MKRHTLDDESTHPGSLIAGSRLPQKRGPTWSTLLPPYSMESDYAPGPWSAAAAATDEADAELDPVRAAPKATSGSQPDFGTPPSPFKQRIARARLEPIDDDPAGCDVDAPTCWFCGLGGGGGAEAPDAAPDVAPYLPLLDLLGFRSAEAASSSASWTTDAWFSASGAVPPPPSPPS